MVQEPALSRNHLQRNLHRPERGNQLVLFGDSGGRLRGFGAASGDHLGQVAQILRRRVHPRLQPFISGAGPRQNFNQDQLCDQHPSGVRAVDLGLLCHYAAVLHSQRVGEQLV